MRNSDIAELLARESEHARMPAKKALRRASRRAFLWPEEAAEMVEQGRSLTELAAVGPYLERLTTRWIKDPPELPKPPEIRSNFLTITAAHAVLTKKPSWLTAIKGDLQMHTVWSDGEGTIEEMAQAAIERGYQYIAITDHSKGLKIAGGIDEEQLQRQADEIEHVNATLRAEGVRVRVFRSIELNLDTAGKGDMEPGGLQHLEVVLGCFHSALRKKEDQTHRYIAALRNPDIQILGHPRGRVYNYRIGLTADWERVFGVAAELDKAVEIDAYPDRQDLSMDLVRIAKKSGCRISLGTDSHDPQQLRFMDFALASAIKAGIKKDRILNFMAAEEFVEWVASVRQRNSSHISKQEFR
jgi:histidinol phosphatase-like PHP family hydrolase